MSLHISDRQDELSGNPQPFLAQDPTSISQLYQEQIISKLSRM